MVKFWLFEAKGEVLFVEETLKNLHKAFIGESQARNRYAMWAKQALTDGYDQISGIFLETAEQEREHAVQLSKMINALCKKAGKKQGPVLVEAEGAAMFGTTKQNLKDAIAGEHYETSEMYPGFAKAADDEGLKDVADRLRAIAVAERHHEERYSKLLKELQLGTFLKKTTTQVWVCRKCGYQHKGVSPPDKCPACGHEKGYYQLKCEEY